MELPGAKSWPGWSLPGQRPRRGWGKVLLFSCFKSLFPEVHGFGGSLGIGLVLLLWPRCWWCHSVLIEWQPVTNTGGCVRAPALPAPMAPCCVLCPFPKHIPAIFGSLGLVAALAPSIPSREVWEIRLSTLIPPSGRLFPLYLAALAIRKKKIDVYSKCFSHKYHPKPGRGARDPAFSFSI